MEEHERTCEVTQEMERMRLDARMDVIYPFLEDDYVDCRANVDGGGGGVSIVFQNIQNFRSNREKLANDFGYQRADLILLVECHNYTNRRLEASRLLQHSHELVHYTSARGLNTSHGQICFVRKGIHHERLKFVAHNANIRNEYVIGEQQISDLNSLVELSMFEYMYSQDKVLYIVSAYKHQKCHKMTCLQEIGKFLCDNIPARERLEDRRPNVLLMGDFNVDFGRQENKDCMTVLQDQMNVRSLLPENSKTFENISYIDWCFKNRNFRFQVESQLYETWFSDHSAIWTEVKFE